MRKDFLDLVEYAHELGSFRMKLSAPHGVNVCAPRARACCSSLRASSCGTPCCLSSQTLHILHLRLQ
jgi:hypothetical protein